MAHLLKKRAQSGMVLTLTYEQCEKDAASCFDAATAFTSNEEAKATDVPLYLNDETCVDDWTFLDKMQNGCFVWDDFECSDEVRASRALSHHAPCHTHDRRA